MSPDDLHSLIPLRVPDDIVRARQAGRQAAARLGFGIADQTRLATAISEITRNALHYGGGGQCEIIGHGDPFLREIRISVTDHGPGIHDVEQAMIPGFSTGHSLGMGLPGARRLVDQLTIDTRPGYTNVTMTMRRRGNGR